MAIAVRNQSVQPMQSSATSPYGLPLVSVIVPTRNRAATLRHLMLALGDQTYPKDRIELVVVDNDSADDTQAVFEDLRSGLPFKATFIRQKDRGPAGARNTGAAAARGEILAFTDSDCIPCEGWITEGVAAMSAGAGVVAGSIQPIGPVGLLWKQVPDRGHDDGIYPTANLFTRKADFHRLGGFDERYGVYPWGGLMGGEDTELAWRLRRAGASAAFAGAALVEHQSTRTTPRAWLLSPLAMQVLPKLVRDIPELRRTYLWRGYFASRSHFLFDVLILGGLAAALSSWWEIAVLAALPWLFAMHPALFAYLRRGRPDRAFVVLGLLGYAYAGSLLVLLVASFRYWRLVL